MGKHSKQTLSWADTWSKWENTAFITLIKFFSDLESRYKVIKFSMNEKRSTAITAKFLKFLLRSINFHNHPNIEVFAKFSMHQ